MFPYMNVYIYGHISVYVYIYVYVWFCMDNDAIFNYLTSFLSYDVY